MFYWMLASIFIMALLVIHRLRSIQKNAMTQLMIIKYQKSVMDYLRKNDPNLNDDDYSKLKDMLAMNDKLMDQHVCKQSSLLHSLHFIEFTKTMVRKSFAMDKIISEYKSNNQYVIEARENLDRLITWSLFYNTPFAVKIMVLFSLIVKLVTLKLKLSRMKFSKDMYSWYGTIVFDYSKEDLFKRWNLLVNFLHLGSEYTRIRVN